MMHSPWPTSEDAYMLCLAARAPGPWPLAALQAVAAAPLVLHAFNPASSVYNAELLSRRLKSSLHAVRRGCPDRDCRGGLSPRLKSLRPVPCLVFAMEVRPMSCYLSVSRGYFYLAKPHVPSAFCQKPGVLLKFPMPAGGRHKPTL